MDSGELIFKKRSDTGKIYVFLPRTGKTLEFKSKNVTMLYELLQLIKQSSSDDLELLFNYNRRGLLKGVASEALGVYGDLRELQVTFSVCNTRHAVEEYIKTHDLYKT